MTDHTSDAHGLPENQDFFRSSTRPTSAHSHDDSAHAFFEEGRSDDGGASAPADLPATSATNPDGSPARPKRRRGSRGGRRRRGRGANADAATTGTSEPVADDASDAPQAEHDERDDHAPRDGDDAPATPHDGAHDGAPGAPNKRKRSRRGRRGRGRGNLSAPASEPRFEDGPVEPPLPDEDDDFAGRSTGVPREIDAHDDEIDIPSAAPSAARSDAGDAGEAGRKKRRRRGSRGGRRRKEKHSPEAVARVRELPAEIETIPGEEDDFPELPELPLETELIEPDAFENDAPERAPDRGPRGGRKSRRKKVGDKRPVREREVEAEEDDEPMQVPEAQRNGLILVNATDPEEQRVAVVEDEQIVDFQMTVKDQDSLVNDIYRGRVVNLEPAIGAAFVDFGQGRNGFLHTSDVLSMYGDKEWSLDKLLSTKIDPEEWAEGGSQPSADFSDDESGEKREEGGKKQRRPKAEHKRRFRARPRLPITDLLKKGQMVVVQVTKDAIGDKGPTLTTYISIPGRYLVLMPSMSRTGVSRKIEDEKERRRLKRILQSLDVPPGMGVIVRTAGVGHSKMEIKRDLDYLTSAWDAFGKRLSSGHGPAPLYRESDVAIRTMRDLFTPNTKAVIVDDPEVHRHICEFTEKLMPENVERVKLHQGARPLFQSYGIEPDFEKIFSRRIELPSGGSIVFDQAEALVAIDVNSGRTRSDGFDFEEIALKTNLEAVPEIARQIRLRDLGGILVVDFIDMMKMGNIRAVERAFKDELDKDRARSKIGRISMFGLLELTRQRLGPGMSKKAFHSCPRCRGTGRIRTVNSRAAAILRRLASAMTLKGFSTCEVRAHPEVIAYLQDSCSEYIRALEYRFSREVKLIEAADQQEDSVLRYLRTDGKEVRPGGRRKR
jgi:ribonuclease E